MIFTTFSPLSDCEAENSEKAYWSFFPFSSTKYIALLDFSSFIPLIQNTSGQIHKITVKYMQSLCFCYMAYSHPYYKGSFYWGTGRSFTRTLESDRYSQRGLQATVDSDGMKQLRVKRT